MSKQMLCYMPYLFHVYHLETIVVLLKI
uniref:Uncharacterized protein n=1 Tax=Rhizophora mucronata TaxID=61149 RepID=A0A2P2PUY5_RHIMU